jgi:hypothetical protein
MFHPQTMTHIPLPLATLLCTLLISTSAVAQPAVSAPQADNIVVVKKYRYNDPLRAALQIKAGQTICTDLKKAAYKETRNPIYAPQTQDNLSLDEIIQLQDITVTEYFSGTSYARYETGHSWEAAYSNIESDKVRDTEMYCRLVAKPTLKAEIRTPMLWLLVSNLANKEQGLATYESGNIPPKKPIKNLLPQKVPNSNFDCVSRPELASCFLKDSPIHAGTNREVVMQTKVPAKGDNPAVDAFNDLPVPLLQSQGSFKFGDVAKVYEHVSTVVAKEIALKIFELPPFAKDYKVVRK